ncbi:hypothetical protein SAY86_032054 [Trapa natans]|uniref:OCEL domain-containing protein n=1 Tax=Trapa natans TaxID=22666 RepID=A0AAN7R8W9_TRANT|nr:hypothetical protein SAY86_032054 [Trapa natans]
MFGGSTKFGRGGGRGGGGGANKRFSVPPQPPRPSVPGGMSRSGGLPSRNPGPSSAAPPAMEEAFRLVSGNNPLAFAMTIRLVPDLVEEIRRAEAQGETSKIKFGLNPTNPNGNLISVGGKEFRFTWSKEFGDLCDIYEERESGEDGNGLLVESGCAWRKVNVQRILDESTTNHVKMLSEEAERKNKARKAIVLDHENPVMKSQLKQLAAVESTSWRMGFKRKEPPPKKRKVDPPHVSSVGPQRSTYKSGLPSGSKTTGKGGHAISPPISSPIQFQTSAFPSGAVNIAKNNALIEEAGLAGQPSKEDATERETGPKPGGMSPDRSGHKLNLDSKTTDLQSMLISLLKDNPRGMTIKTLEKMIGHPIPSSGKKILSRIANCQAPGKYFLKPGVELEGFKGPSPGSGSSFEDDHNQENFYPTLVEEPTSPKELPSNNGIMQENLASPGALDASENIDIEKHSPDADKKNSDNSVGRVDSSSDSGSDSDSDSHSTDSRSDSGSPSRSRSQSRSRSRSRSPSRSRSKSPARSQSDSSSDSDSDASSNQEGSDEDVDIMVSDDDKALDHTAIPDMGNAFPGSPLDGGILDIDGVDDKHDGHESDIVDIDAVEETNYGHGASVEEMNPISASHNGLQERQNLIGSLFDEEETAFEGTFKQEPSENSMRVSKGQTRRRHSGYSDTKHEQMKRLKTESSHQTAVQQCDNRPYSSPRDLSPERNNEHMCESPAVRMPNRADRDMNAESSFQRRSQAFPGKFSGHSQLNRRSYDLGPSGKAYDVSGKPNRQVEGSSHGRFSMQKERSVAESQFEGYGTAAERGIRNGKEGISGSKYPVSDDSPYYKSSETIGNNLQIGKISSLQMGSSQENIDRYGTERPSLVNGKGGAILQRELSGLELGELLPEEAPVNKPSDRKGFSKLSENKSNNSENRSIVPSRGKTSGKSKVDLGKPSPSKMSRMRTVEGREGDSVVPFVQGAESQLPYLPIVDHGDGSAPITKMADVSKPMRNGQQQLESKQGKVPRSIKESKRQAVGTTINMTSGQKEAVSADYGGGLKRRESSSDENSCSYSKYEKDEPELKGRIKDFQQYEEYVQEFCDKYDSYCCINKTLGNYRNEFLKMGKELELAKGRDLERYNHIEAQLRDSFRLCGQKRERLSKIFTVLHAELKHLKRMITDFAQAYSKGSS